MSASQDQINLDTWLVLLLVVVNSLMVNYLFIILRAELTGLTVDLSVYHSILLYHSFQLSQICCFDYHLPEELLSKRLPFYITDSLNHSFNHHLANHILI